MKSFSIGNIKLKNPLILAPMVDVTDLPYRLICRKAGASLAYTEMLNTGAIIHENKKTQDLMKTSKSDKPVGIQVTGPTIDDFKKIIPHIRKYNYDLVDINCGCPSIRTLDNKSGSYLLQNPKKISEYIKILKNEGFTTTAKIRLGFKTNNVIEIAKEIEKAGADALTIHARLAHHSNKIPADWSWIKKVKKEIGIPLIGNGDITRGIDAQQMLEIADGAMIARGAIGDPLIFDRILYYLKTGKEKEFDFEKNIELFNSYLELTKKNDLTDLHRIRSLGCNFLRNHTGVAKLRSQFMQLKNLDEMQEFVKAING